MKIKTHFLPMMHPPRYYGIYDSITVRCTSDVYWGLFIYNMIFESFMENTIYLISVASSISIRWDYLISIATKSLLVN